MARRRDATGFVEMFGALKKRFAAVAAQAYGGADLGTMQARLLQHLGQHPRISQAELARATGSDPTLTGRVLKALIARGLVRRERSDVDRREYVLELGAPGRRAHERVEKLRAELAARLGEALDERDLEDFDRIAKKILAAFAVPDEER